MSSKDGTRTKDRTIKKEYLRWMYVGMSTRDGSMQEQIPEMEKCADTADISVLFFSGCANILAVYAN